MLHHAFVGTARLVVYYPANQPNGVVDFVATKIQKDGRLLTIGPASKAAATCKGLQ
jgi:hypothetical protein